MTRAWWGWASRESAPESHKTAPVSDSAALDDQSGHPHAPTGRLTWIVHTPSGAKSVHPTEAAAKLRAAESDGAVWYPAVVEERETA